MDLSFLRVRGRSISGRNASVSILVLMDFSFLHAVEVSYGKFLESFQSLFLWIFRSYPFIYTLTLSILQSFNPCSYGSSVLTGREGLRQLKLACISILVLMDLSFLRTTTSLTYLTR